MTDQGAHRKTPREDRPRVVDNTSVSDREQLAAFRIQNESARILPGMSVDGDGS